jgi:hypothetical protein
LLFAETSVRVLVVKLLGPQPWHASLFYFLVAPLVQASSPGVYFDPDTLEVLVDNAGWKAAASFFKRLYAAGRFTKSSSLVYTDWPAGRCAFIAALPGMTKKAVLTGIPPRTVNSTVVWSGGVAERIKTPTLQSLAAQFGDFHFGWKEKPSGKPVES